MYRVWREETTEREGVRVSERRGCKKDGEGYFGFFKKGKTLQKNFNFCQKKKKKEDQIASN